MGQSFSIPKRNTSLEQDGISMVVINPQISTQPLWQIPTPELLSRFEKEDNTKLFYEWARRNDTRLKMGIASEASPDWITANVGENNLRKIKELADANDEEAQFILAYLLQNGEIGLEPSKEEAIKWYRKSAFRGYALAQTELGRMYERGNFSEIKKNERTAVTFYLAASEQGEVEAQYHLARMYEEGRGVEKSIEEAASWYRKAAENGNVAARDKLKQLFPRVAENTVTIPLWKMGFKELEEMEKKDANNPKILYEIARRYYEGRGVRKDHEKFQEWNGKFFANRGIDFIKRLAAENDGEAQFILGSLYEVGQGNIGVDKILAYQWYLKSANQEYAAGAFQLGRMYQEGIGVEKDLDQALIWYKKAGKNGYFYAWKYVDLISRQIEKAKKEELPHSSSLSPQELKGKGSADMSPRSSNLVAEKADYSLEAEGKKNSQVLPVSLKKTDEQGQIEANKKLLKSLSTPREERTVENSGGVHQAMSNLPKGLRFQKIPGDGHCLFHAVGLYLGQDARSLRHIISNYMENNFEQFQDFYGGSKEQFKQHIQAIATANEWGTHIEIEVLQRITKKPIIIIQPVLPPIIPDNIEVYQNPPIFIYYNQVDHYDSFVLEEGADARAILQEIIRRLAQNVPVNYQLTQFHGHSQKSVEDPAYIGSKSTSSVTKKPDAVLDSKIKKTTRVVPALFKKAAAQAPIEANKKLSKPSPAPNVNREPKGKEPADECSSSINNAMKMDERASLIKLFSDESDPLEDLIPKIHPLTAPLWKVSHEDLLAQAAQKNDVKLWYELGRRYELGLGIEVNKKSAEAWYRKCFANNGLNLIKQLAEGNDPEFQFILGRIYDKGQAGAREDHTRAHQYYLKAASQKHAPAENNLGVIYENGKGIAKNLQQAFTWYKTSSQRNYPPAENNLARMYEYGLGAKQNYWHAVEWYEFSAKHGYEEAKNYLPIIRKKLEKAKVLWKIPFVYLLKEGLETKDLKVWYEIGRRFNHGLGVKENYEKYQEWNSKFFANNGFTLIKKLAESNDIEAQFILGIIYATGLNGISIDEVEAEKWYWKAANQGYAPAQVNLGQIYFGDRNKDKDYSLTFKLYQKAARQGYARGEYHLALMYQMGKGTIKDLGQAIIWFKKAAAQNYPWAEHYLGKMYENGWGVSKDLQQAIYWYENSAEHGCSYSRDYLPTIRQKLNDLKILWKILLEDLLLQAPISNEVKIKYELGRRYELGLGTEENKEIAEQWYTKCFTHNGWDNLLQMAEKNDEQAQFIIGRVYDKGQAGVRQDYVIARQWYMKATIKNYAPAESNVGQLYEYGLGVEKDLQAALNWYQKANTQNETLSQYALGQMYENGRYIEKSYAIAFSYYQAAAHQGYALAEYKLGWMYHTGLGVNKDENLAMDWYQKAAAKRNADALVELGIIQENQGKRELALSYYKRAAATGNAKAHAHLYFLAASWFVGQKEPDAIEWLKKAANEGYVKAQSWLGSLYANSSSTDVSYNSGLAFYWTEKAANKGDMQSQSRLASMYEDGIGVAQNIQEALSWHHRVLSNPAAEFLHSLSYYHMGQIYEKGKGVAIDRRKAISYYKQASAHGDYSLAGHISRLEYLIKKENEPEPTYSSSFFSPSQADLEKARVAQEIKSELEQYNRDVEKYKRDVAEYNSVAKDANSWSLQAGGNCPRDVPFIAEGKVNRARLLKIQLTSDEWELSRQLEKIKSRAARYGISLGM